MSIDAGLAHDLNHLLGLITDYAGLVYERVCQCEPKGCWSNEVTQEVLHDSASLLACLERVGDLTDRLLGPKLDPPERGRLDLNQLVREVEPLLGPESRGRVRVRVRLWLADGLWPVVADRVDLEQVLMNLCGNAREAMADGGVLSIRTENVLLDDPPAAAGTAFGPALAPGPYVCLSVADTGPGIPADVLARVADPGFSTKSPARNRGLGLTTVVRILGRMRGGFHLCSERGGETVARVYVPATQEVTAPDVGFG